MSHNHKSGSGASTPPHAHSQQDTYDIPDVVSDLRMRMRDQSNLAIAVAAMQTLTEVVRKSKASTLMGLEIELKDAVDQLKACNKSSISLAAGCELFSRYVTRTSLDVPVSSIFLFVSLCVVFLFFHSFLLELKLMNDRTPLSIFHLLLYLFYCFYLSHLRIACKLVILTN